MARAVRGQEHAELQRLGVAPRQQGHAPEEGIVDAEPVHDGVAGSRGDEPDGHVRARDLDVGLGRLSAGVAGTVHALSHGGSAEQRDVGQVDRWQDGRRDGRRDERRGGRVRRVPRRRVSARQRVPGRHDEHRRRPAQWLDAKASLGHRQDPNTDVVLAGREAPLELHAQPGLQPHPGVSGWRSRNAASAGSTRLWVSRGWKSTRGGAPSPARTRRAAPGSSSTAASARRASG